MVYALDTNTIIHLLHLTPAVIKRRDAAIEQGMQLVIPPYVNFEIKRGFHYVSAPRKEQLYKQLLTRYPVGDMSAETWELAAVLYADTRRSGRTVDDADLLIAAFCIVGDYTLVTNNTRHFEGIDGLKLEDWTVDVKSSAGA
jgi:tRNA(fMet)-specific endonuclease VapC